MYTTDLIPDELIVNKILEFRSVKVMIDSDLAQMYGVETKVLNQAVKRNLKRFPEDFMFQLHEDEFANLKSQFVTSSWGGRRKLPFVFTEQGVAMLSSVLSSDRAIEVNIRIIRIFTRLRTLLLTDAEFRLKLDQLERQVEQNSRETAVVFDALRELILEKEEAPRQKIGYKVNVES